MFGPIRKIGKFQGERGETQLGIIILTLLLGVGIFLLATLQSCIQESKDTKAQKRSELFRSKIKIKKEYSVKGYTVER